MNTKQTVLRTFRPTNRFRLLGILPLLFFLARVIEYAVVAKTPEQILWGCHISNLLLAIGMFVANPFLIRVAVFWLILGLPPWILDMVVSRLITPVSIFSHLGGFMMAIVAIRHAGAKRGSWFPSLLYFLVLQQVSRLLTQPTPYTNVNVAHFAYGPWKDLFASYWKYWVVNTALTMLALVIIEQILLWLFPRPKS
ncbi:MAG: hypothetical protein ACREEM_23560 [Blastocatellia bacterium]